MMTNEEMEKKHTAPEVNAAPASPIMAMAMPAEPETETANIGEEILAAVAALIGGSGG
jgi:hypothetical protein